MDDRVKTREQLLEELATTREILEKTREGERDRQGLLDALKESQDKLSLLLRQSEALLACASALLNHSDYQEAAGRIFDECKRLIGAQSGYVALGHETSLENEVLYLDSGGAECDVDPSLPMPIRGMRGEAYSKRAALFHNDFDNSEWRSLIPEGHSKLENVLMAPMLVDGKAVGLLGLANKPGGFKEEDCRWAMAMAEFSAIGLMNTRTVQALEMSEARFRSVVETAGDAIVCIDRYGKVVMWNDGAERVFGYSREEIMGARLAALMPEAMRTIHDRALERVGSQPVESLTRQTVEVTCLGKGGREFPAELSVAPWETPDGRFYTGIVRDISERKLAEREIEETRAGFVGIVENSPDGILVLDDDGSVLYANRSAYNLFGRAEGTLLGTCVGLPASKGSIAEVDIILPNGDSGFAEMRREKADWMGKRANLAIFRDYTERKRAEILQGQLLEEIRHFAYILSHDLRTPIINLKGFTGELQMAMEVLAPIVKGAIQGLPEETRCQVASVMEKELPECLGFIDSAASRMERLISAIQNLSRLERSELTLEEVDMKRLVLEAMESVCYEINRRGVRIDVEELPQVRADRFAMEQIMSHLITNAVSFLDQDRPGEIRIRGERAEGETIFHVRDNGRGIGREDLRKVFDIFRRVGAPDVPGEGMGLTYVRSLVRRHGGRLWCDSTLGIGSVFSFSVSNHLEPSKPPLRVDDGQDLGSGELDDGEVRGLRLELCRGTDSKME